VPISTIRTQASEQPWEAPVKQYDFALISEMPDAQSAAVLPLVISAGGAVTDTVTTQAFTTAEGKDLFERAGKIVGSYKPMGAS